MNCSWLFITTNLQKLFLSTAELLHVLCKYWYHSKWLSFDVLAWRNTQQISIQLMYSICLTWDLGQSSDSNVIYVIDDKHSECTGENRNSRALETVEYTAVYHLHILGFLPNIYNTIWSGKDYRKYSLHQEPCTCAQYLGKQIILSYYEQSLFASFFPPQHWIWFARVILLWI